MFDRVLIFLQEVAYLMFRLQHRLHDVSPELTQILCFLRTVGLDASGMGILVRRSLPGEAFDPEAQPMDGYIPEIVLIENSNTYRFTQATAQGWAVVLAQETEDSFPLQSYFESFDLEENCSVGPRSPFIVAPSGCTRANQRQKAVSVYCHYTDLASSKLAKEHFPQEILILLIDT